MLEVSTLAAEVMVKHLQYGVRCCFCDFKWPCEPVRLAREHAELQSQIIVLKARYDKLRYGKS